MCNSTHITDVFFSAQITHIKLNWGTFVNNEVGRGHTENLQSQQPAFNPKTDLRA
jgi:hypothetical protein